MVSLKDEMTHLSDLMIRLQHMGGLCNSKWQRETLEKTNNSPYTHKRAETTHSAPDTRLPPLESVFLMKDYMKYHGVIKKLWEHTPRFESSSSLCAL